MSTEKVLSDKALRAAIVAALRRMGGPPTSATAILAELGPVLVEPAPGDRHELHSLAELDGYGARREALAELLSAMARDGTLVEHPGDPRTYSTTSFVEAFARKGRIKLTEAETARYEGLVERLRHEDMTDRDWRDLVLVAADQAGANPETIERIAALLLNDDRVAS